MSDVVENPLHHQRRLTVCSLHEVFIETCHLEVRISLFCLLPVRDQDEQMQSLKCTLFFHREPPQK